MSDDKEMCKVLYTLCEVMNTFFNSVFTNESNSMNAKSDTGILWWL